MFNKSKIATAVVAAACGTIGVANTAHAVQLNNDQSMGQIMILPYYNVNNNFTTSIAITNTTAEFKAVKIRFRESGESQDVLDFNIYMSPFDQWDAAVRLNPDTGTANLVTTDTTCTFPTNVGQAPTGVGFIDAYDNVDGDDMTEGYVEIIEMGVIADGTGPADDGGQCAQLDGTGDLTDCDVDDDLIVVDLIEHVDGVPTDCNIVEDAWDFGGDLALGGDGGFTSGALAVTDGSPTSADGIAVDDTSPGPGTNTAYLSATEPGQNGGLVPPTGGLSAFGILINNATGAAFVKEADHITNWATVPQHYKSDDPDNYLLPSLASGDVTTSSWLNDAGDTAVVLTWPLTYFDTGANVDIAPNPRIPAGSNPLPISAVLAADAIANDYFLDPVISGSTDWVVAFPMKKHNVWNGMRLDVDISNDGDPCAPGVSVEGFTKWPITGDCEDAGFVDDADHEGEGTIYTITYWDREENLDIPEPEDHVPSPPTVTPRPFRELNREVNVITFNRQDEEPDSVLGTPADNVTREEVVGGFITGWALLDFGTATSSYEFSTDGNALDDLVEPDVDGSIAATNQVDGVPVGGFSALEGEIGPASVGETLEYMKAHNRAQTP